MNETVSSILPQILMGLVWPVAILALAIAFRKGIRPRFKEGRKVGQLDGSTTEKANDLAERIEKKPER